MSTAVAAMNKANEAIALSGGAQKALAILGISPEAALMLEQMDERVNQASPSQLREIEKELSAQEREAGEAIYRSTRNIYLALGGVIAFMASVIFAYPLPPTENLILQVFEAVTKFTIGGSAALALVTIPRSLWWTRQRRFGYGLAKLAFVQQLGRIPLDDLEELNRRLLESDANRQSQEAITKTIAHRKDKTPQETLLLSSAKTSAEEMLKLAMEGKLAENPQDADNFSDSKEII